MEDEDEEQIAGVGANVSHPMLGAEGEEGQKLQIYGMPLFMLPFVLRLTILCHPVRVHATFKRSGCATQIEPVKVCLPTSFSSPHLTSLISPLHSTLLNPSSSLVGCLCYPRAQERCATKQE